jgi:hypothetical protein
MPKRKKLEEMSLDEMIEYGQQFEEQRQRRNARRRERRQWLKTASREETALRYRAQERPCSVAVYLQAERFVLRWLDEFPSLKEDAMFLLLTLAHNILHLLYPEKECAGETLADCPAFNRHELCNAAIDIALNYRLDPAFKQTHSQVFLAMVGLTEGLDLERLRLNSLLGDISIDL